MGCGGTIVHLLDMLQLKIPLERQLGNHTHKTVIHECPPDVASIVRGLHRRPMVMLAATPWYYHQLPLALCKHMLYVMYRPWMRSAPLAGV